MASDTQSAPALLEVKGLRAGYGETWAVHGIDFRVDSGGVTALLGAKLALFSLKEHQGAYPEILAKVRHVSLNEAEGFQDIYVEEMGFPG